MNSELHERNILLKNITAFSFTFEIDFSCGKGLFLIIFLCWVMCITLECLKLLQSMPVQLFLLIRNWLSEKMLISLDLIFVFSINKLLYLSAFKSFCFSNWLYHRCYDIFHKICSFSDTFGHFCNILITSSWFIHFVFSDHFSKGTNNIRKRANCNFGRTKVGCWEICRTKCQSKPGIFCRMIQVFHYSPSLRPYLVGIFWIYIFSENEIRLKTSLIYNF